MASIKMVKRSAMKAGGPVGAPAAGNFQLVDNGDDTVTVQGVDAAGNPVDISALATIAVVSSDSTVLTVDPPSGMTYAMHAVGKIGSAAVTITATWNDGSIGPFTATDNVDVVAGGPAGIQIVHAAPTVH